MLTSSAITGRRSDSHFCIVTKLSYDLNLNSLHSRSQYGSVVSDILHRRTLHYGDAVLSKTALSLGIVYFPLSTTAKTEFERSTAIVNQMSQFYIQHVTKEHEVDFKFFREFNYRTGARLIFRLHTAGPLEQKGNSRLSARSDLG